MSATRHVIRLTGRQVLQLQSIRRRCGDWRTARRVTAVLMSSRGRSVPEICEATGYDPASVSLLRRRWNQVGLAALFPKPSPGCPPKADRMYRQRLVEVVKTPPATFGYAFAQWSAARLEAHMRNETGVEITPDRLRIILHEEDFSYKRARHTLKNKRNPRAFRKAQRLLDALKKGRKIPPPRTNSGSATRPGATCSLT